MFIDYSQTVDDVYENSEYHNLTKKRNVLIVLDDMITDTEADKKLSPVVIELLLRILKLTFLLIFMPQSYFKVSKFKD